MGWVCSVAFSPDGKCVISGSDDKTIRLWDLQMGAQIGKPFTGHRRVVLSVAFSPDGKHIVSGSGKTPSVSGTRGRGSKSVSLSRDTQIGSPLLHSRRIVGNLKCA